MGHRRRHGVAHAFSEPMARRSYVDGPEGPEKLSMAQWDIAATPLRWPTKQAHIPRPGPSSQSDMAKKRTSSKASGSTRRPTPVEAIEHKDGVAPSRSQFRSILRKVAWSWFAR